VQVPAQNLNVIVGVLNRRAVAVHFYMKIINKIFKRSCESCNGLSLAVFPHRNSFKCGSCNARYTIPLKSVATEGVFAVLIFVPAVYIGVRWHDWVSLSSLFVSTFIWSCFFRRLTQLTRV